MARHAVRWAVLGALAACGLQEPELEGPANAVPEPPPPADAPPVDPRPAIPELDARPTIPELDARPTIPELDGPPPRPDSGPPGDRVREYASVALTGRFIEASGEAPLDLSVQADREQVVRACLRHADDPTTCDLRAVLPPSAWFARHQLTEMPPHAWLGPDYTWRNTGVECTPHAGVCWQETRIDGRTGECAPFGPPACRRGRPFDDRVAALHGDARTAAGRAWARVALDEHASIASFARHVLELLAVGAPAELVEGAAQAQRDELAHARLALGLAVRFGADAELGFGPLDTRVPTRTALVDILHAVAEEGCVGETLAAVEAAVALEQADDPHVRAVLEVIVADESRHAALAWRTLAWGLPRLTPEERVRVLAACVAGVVPPGPDQPAGIGVLGGEAAARARAWGLAEVVRPALAALSAA